MRISLTLFVSERIRWAGCPPSAGANWTRIAWGTAIVNVPSPFNSNRLTSAALTDQTLPSTNNQASANILIRYSLSWRKYMAASSRTPDFSWIIGISREPLQPAPHSRFVDPVLFAKFRFKVTFLAVDGQ